MRKVASKQKKVEKHCIGSKASKAVTTGLKVQKNNCVETNLAIFTQLVVALVWSMLMDHKVPQRIQLLIIDLKFQLQ